MSEKFPQIVIPVEAKGEAPVSFNIPTLITETKVREQLVGEEFRKSVLSFFTRFDFVAFDIGESINDYFLFAAALRVPLEGDAVALQVRLSKDETRRSIRGVLELVSPYKEEEGILVEIYNHL